MSDARLAKWIDRGAVLLGALLILGSGFLASWLVDPCPCHEQQWDDCDEL